jgi:pyruvate-ferredoxin/flavodoxin oxidoreductase
VVSNAEAVVDYLRETRGIKVGVIDVTMFRPFPADVLTGLLKGKRAVTVLERVDQPLAVDAPLLREIRAAMGKAVENGRAKGDLPHPGVVPCSSDEVPDFLSGCFGLGSRDLQPGDLVAAVENMLDGGAGRRHFYLGIDFVRPETRMPKLQIWQQELLDAYPQLQDLTLASAGDIDLLPEGSTSIRIHSIGGWGAITMGKNLAVTAAEMFDLHLKANPKYGSEKKGQPTRFYASLSEDPIRTNCELKHVNVVLCPDPGAFRSGDPLEGMADEGVLVIQCDQGPEDLWRSLPRHAQREILSRNIRVHHLDAFAIAADEASDPELRFRMQGTAFLGAFFAIWERMRTSGIGRDDFMARMHKQVEKKFGHLGERVVADNERVISRGYDEVHELDTAALEESGDGEGAPLRLPDFARGCGVGIADPGRFFEQVASVYGSGDDPIADPFAAISAIPAATSTLRDMTEVRFEVPEFVPDKCTGCSQCWVQCPDAAIPGLVNTVEEVLGAAVAAAGNGKPLDRMRQAVTPLAREARRVMKATPFTTFSDALATAYAKVAPKVAPDPERRKALDEEFAPVATALLDFPLAKTAPFYELPEDREKGTGGLLSVTINPEACKGCNICVEVCPDGALRTIKQDDEVVDKLRRDWDLWHHLPDTNDRYVNVSDVDEGIGVLSSLLLKKDNYRSMAGGDGACMGCGEKTGVHLVLSAVNAAMFPKVKIQVARLDGIIERLDALGREILASDADLDAAARVVDTPVEIPLGDETRDRLRRITELTDQLKDLRWRYAEGPTGHGRSPVGFANSTGCSSVWGSTYPYNPYPFPWVNHLFQDAPSIAIGLFEGHMRTMADGFEAVRRAEIELEGRYDAAVHEPFFTAFDWHQFDDDEFALCPPLFAVGGDGAMLDIGFQNLSRLMASGKPIRVLVLDTQVYSNTGGQACTSGFFGQVSDMAAFGAAHHGKEETRKELALIAMAHRGTYVLQSSQAASSHLLRGVLRALQTRRPAVIVLHCPCPPEHGTANESAAHQARLATESRAFPLLTYDPDEGPLPAEALSLDGNPALEDDWPEYDLVHLLEDGSEARLTLPLTIADWAATEARFKKHFRVVPSDVDEDDLAPFHEFLAKDDSGREGLTPFIHALDEDKHLQRVAVSSEIVALAEDRLSLWHRLKQLAGVEASDAARDTVTEEITREFEERLAALQSDHDTRIAELKSQYPAFVARRLAEGLLQSGSADRTVGELLELAQSTAGLAPVAVAPPPVGTPAPVPASKAPSPAVPPPPAAAEPQPDDDEDEDISLEPWIESARCTACNECTNINDKLFAYNDKKQAYVKDRSAGTFRQIVTAAETCPVRIIHPGSPLNPREKDLEKWMKRAEPFQ